MYSIEEIAKADNLIVINTDNKNIIERESESNQIGGELTIDISKLIFSEDVLNNKIDTMIENVQSYFLKTYKEQYNYFQILSFIKNNLTELFTDGIYDNKGNYYITFHEINIEFLNDIDENENPIISPDLIYLLEKIITIFFVEVIIPNIPKEFFENCVKNIIINRYEYLNEDIVNTTWQLLNINNFDKFYVNEEDEIIQEICFGIFLPIILVLL